MEKNEVPKNDLPYSHLSKKHKTASIVGVVAAVAIVGWAVIHFWPSDDLGMVGSWKPPVKTESEPVKAAPPLPVAVAEPVPDLKMEEGVVLQPPLPEQAAPAAKPAKRKATQSPSPVIRTSAGEFLWKHFGAAPYATTRAEAMRTREDALRRLGFGESCVQALTEATGKTGERIVIHNGDRFSRMISTGGAVHRNVVVAFDPPKENPKMQFSAPAERWTVTVKGASCTVVLPDVCNNWSVPFIQAPPVRTAANVPPPPVCYEIAFPATPGQSVNWGIATYRGPFPPDECNAERQGTMPWVAWNGDCPDCVPREYQEKQVPVPHHFRYPVMAREQILRFSDEVLKSVVYLCLGEEHCGIAITKDDWKGKTRIEISPERLSHPREDCPNF